MKMKSQSREKIERLIKKNIKFLADHRAGKEDKITISCSKLIKWYKTSVQTLIDEAKAQEKTSLLGEVREKVIGNYIKNYQEWRDEVEVQYKAGRKTKQSVVLVPYYTWLDEKQRKALEDVGGGK